MVVLSLKYQETPLRIGRILCLQSMTYGRQRSRFFELSTLIKTALLSYFNDLSQTMCSDFPADGIGRAAGILRLSTKYCIRILRAKSIAMLEILCPCHLDKMIARGPAKIEHTLTMCWKLTGIACINTRQSTRVT